MAKLSNEPLIHPGAKVIDCTLGRFSEIGEGTRLLESEIGDYSYTDRFADIAYTSIGKFANIASFARINPGNHPSWRPSLHHFQYRSASYWDDKDDDEGFFCWRRESRCEIGHDSWIGHQAVVLPGRSVGTGAVVGAGTVVTKSVDPYTIVAGNPARSIGERFDVHTAERLMVLAWWDWSHERIGQALPDFRSLTVEAFIEKYDA